MIAILEQDVGFTGTQIGMSNPQLIELRAQLIEAKSRGSLYFHHGELYWC